MWWFLFQTAVFFAVMAFFIENDAYKGFGYAPAFVAGFSISVMLIALVRSYLR